MANKNNHSTLAITSNGFVNIFLAGFILIYFVPRKEFLKMKRAIVVAVRESKNAQTNENQFWISCAIMPSVMNNGGLFYPKSTELIKQVCCGETSKPDMYSFAKTLKIGSLVDIGFGCNENTGKVFVNQLALICESPFTDNDLYI